MRRSNPGVLCLERHLPHQPGRPLSRGHRTDPPRRQRRRKPVALPTRFLLELAAVLRLAAWERQGFRRKLPDDLPTAEEAFADLLDRWTAQTPPSANDADPPLLTQVVMTWFMCFAWNGWEELQVDV